eukprot:gnl/MRDRNA2_/MRDRNA2_28387_c0_seq1.p1 gnl/MRDRNA2_/MRDRNA2_28387_c0~~gnl/MRDRNA2_/MRDRNA2_28387_c0_seq1.p1  ORF type:complete len:625 (+),score=122.01 gnl/MRDRNA2_/MRDRNA2_28387_c0_seq1:63-1937(+)
MFLQMYKCLLVGVLSAATALNENLNASSETVDYHSTFRQALGTLTDTSASLFHQKQEFRSGTSNRHVETLKNQAFNGHLAFLQRDKDDPEEKNEDPAPEAADDEAGITMRILAYLWNMHWKFKIFWSVVLFLLSFIAYEYLSRYIDCEGKGMDPRTWEKKSRNIKTFLMWCGYDEFEEFSILVKIHSVKDVKDTAWVGKSAFKVEVRFKWSRFLTTATQDMKWEQSKYMDVPQGASVCRITLLSEGTRKDKEIGRLELETKHDLLDRSSFFGRQQRLQMTDSKDNPCGVVIATFRKVGNGDNEIPLLEGLKPRSELSCEIDQAAEQEPKMDGGPRPKQGDEKLQLLSRVLQGQLDEAVDGKYQRCFVKVINCNYADLQGKDRAQELAKQIEKARKKGMSQLPKKWYFCWFPDRQNAEAPGLPNPDGFFPMTSLLSVEATKTTGEFLIRYSENNAAVEIKYRRIDKSTEIWIEGLDMFKQEAKKLTELAKGVEAAQEKLPKMWSTHEDYLKESGEPQTMDDWKKWFAYFKEKGYNDEMCKAFYIDLQKKQRTQTTGATSSTASADMSARQPLQASQGIQKHHQQYITEHGAPQDKDEWKRWFAFLSAKGYSEQDCQDLYLALQQQ